MTLPIGAILRKPAGKLLILLVLTLHCFTFARAQSPLPDEKTWHLLIEPTFTHPAVSFPIPGAQRTVLVPGYLRQSGSDIATDPVGFTKAEYDQIHLSLDQFLEKSRANSSEKKVTAKFIRNSQQIIEYAMVQSESPLMATAVLAPDFIGKFKSVLGEKLLVAIPNQNTVFVFPSKTTDYRQYAPIILEAYRQSSHPVSVEVFEPTKTGLRAVGIYDQ